MSIKMLVADDSITIQKVIGIIFGGDDYSLTIVDNGTDAVAKAHEIDPDILLIDALMPGLTGYEVAEAVRSTATLAAKPILILTGSFEPFDEEKAIRCGADGVITKPFESQQIINKVKELLILGESRRQSAPCGVFPEVISEQITPSPVFDELPQSQQQSAPADIWGAFTPSEVDPLETVDVLEPEDFAIITEENAENPFDVADEVIPEVPRTQVDPVQELSFGEIVFEDDEEVTAPESSPTEAEITYPDTPPPSVTLTEEQLKAALSGISKEVIERIVWEVVPDLAEQMIREAIRKIKEGV